MNLKLLSAALLSTALLIGCGDEEENIDVEGCEHLKEGPSSTVNASATTTNLSQVKDDHRRYDISLVDVTGGKGGSVSFSATEEADYVLFTGADVQVAIKDANGQTVAIEDSKTSSSECAEIKGRHTIPMKVGLHTLTFGPTPQASVSVVIEAAAHDDGHEH
ncbi:hypothetical protein [Hyalangium rubrum]|uniref:Lipoprotein n=1 Tax=Hyalangium rubrum TaxID=3103134 RepID=A0ABU5GWH2_9BACT|nr:hypothetical protein [Hyalangium sp. s54d21]MDY7224848.1 hypothetical protein [Hyalangium sp. s54d21]